jgi:hypothetical protein
MRQRCGDGPDVGAARDALQTILGNMPEGHDTLDFHEATSLLH